MSAVQGPGVNVEHQNIKPDPGQQSMVENDKVFREILLQSPGIFLILKGPDLIIEMVNEPLLTLLDRSTEIVGKPLSDILPELKSQPYIGLLQTVLTSGKPYYGYEEKVVLIKSGEVTEKWFNYVLQPIYGEQKHTAGISIMALDVTGQVTTRQNAEKSESQYRLLVDSVRDYAMFMMDMNGEITSWNNGISRILGYRQSEFIGEQLGLIYSEEDRSARVPLNELNMALQSGRVEDARWLIKKDGTRFFAESITTLASDTDGQPFGFTKIFRDITNRKKVEEDLLHAQMESERQKRLYEAVTSSTPDLIYVFDLDYRFTYANEALLKMWGKDWDNAIGKKLLDNGYEPWHAEMHEREIDHVVATKQSIRGEVSFPHATLGRRVYDYILVPVVNEQGNVEAVAGTTRDITELKLAEAALKQSGEELEALVIERTKELQRSNEDLQQFAHVASHDLKEPVRKVRTFTARLKDEFGQKLPETAKSYLSKIEKAAERMYSMIDGVLLYSTINAFEQTRERVNLNEVINSIESDLEMVIQQKEATVRFTNLPEIYGSPVLLYQLFYNLINNSLKFSRSGVKTIISMHSENPDPQELNSHKLNQSNSWKKLTVRDNGIGFNPADAERIFQTFSRLNPKDQYEGTGLGLALCKNIVQRHGGIIYADAKKGEGAEFSIILPASL